MSAGKGKVVYPPGCKEINEELGKDELVRRLKLLARAFQDMGQDDNEQYSGLALYIAQEFFMDHQNKDVRLLVACCIADVFRIFAPDAPYTESAQLKEIFMFLIKQLRGLENTESPSFKRYFYLLENLAWVKSFNICIELEDSQEIFCSLFQLMFSIISDKHSSKVKNFVLDMLTPLIMEADSVSQELLDIILLNIIEPYKFQNKMAYQLARELIIRSSNAIEPFIQAFFNNALMLGKMSESEVSDRLYELIYELNSISPSVLLAVLPQLEFKLKSNAEAERKSVTKLLAKMFSDTGSNLAEQNKPLWNCFIGRFNDISIHVRQTCVSYSQHFLLNHPETYKDIVEQLKVRQHDPEETVRMEVVNVILGVAKKSFERCTDEMLGFIKERTLDKKFQIRQAALLGLGQLYKMYMFTVEDIDKETLEKISWVKHKVFHAYYQNSNEDRLLVERVFNTCLVQYNAPVAERMMRLYLLYSTLDDHAVKAFHEMIKHKNNVKILVSQLVETVEANLQGDSPAVPLHPRMMQLAKTLPETGKASDYVKKFCHMIQEDRRMRQLLKNLVGTDCNSKKAQDLVKEILNKLGGPGPGQQNLFYNSVKSLLERIAPVMIDAEAIDMLVKHVDESVRGLGIMTEGIDSAAEKGVRLLMALSSVYPYYFKSDETFEFLLSFLRNDDEAVADLTIQIFINTGKDLQSSHPNVYSSLLPILQSTAKIGNPKQSKHAIRCISMVCQKKEAIFGQIFEHIKKSLTPESANYITSIVALGHIAKLCPTDFAADIKTIISKIIVKDLLMQDRTSGPDVTDSWYSEYHVTEETMAKLQAMKLLVRWLQGLKSNANNSGTSTLRLLYTVIIHEGDLMERGCINKPELARLRLQAGCCMLKLAEEKCYADIITLEHFQALALLMNDSCYHVRLNFALKLHKGLISMRLPLQYMSIFSLAASDPLRERKQQMKQFLVSNINKRRDYLKQNPSVVRLFHYLPDYVMPYTIHLLAHDPDLKTHEQIDALKNIKECLWFIMEPLITHREYNYPFFRRMLEMIKQCKDAQNAEDDMSNKKLYAVCDIALGLLAAKSTNITLKDTKIEPVLPAKCFTKPDRNFSNTQSYLPKEFMLDGSKRKLQTKIPEIIVESPGVVVNPLPYSPRGKNKKVQSKESQENMSPTRDSDIESPKSSTGSMSPASDIKKGTRKRKLDPKGDHSPEKKRSAKNKGLHTSETNIMDSDDENSQSVKEFGSNCDSDIEEESSPIPKKSRGRPTSRKNSTTSSVNSSPMRGASTDSKSSSKSSLVNGTNKRTLKSNSENTKPSPGNKRSATSSTDSTPVKKARGAGRNAVKNLDTDLSDVSTPQSIASGPTRKGTPKKSAISPAKKSALTRSKVKDDSDDDSDIIPSPTKNSGKAKKNVRKAPSKQLTIDQFGSKAVTKNTKKGKTVSNGTSDEDTPKKVGRGVAKASAVSNEVFVNKIVQNSSHLVIL
ncbi:hypothetical protein FSP39_012194 [Pinctada imbricata]|uniref:Uncharacterized protein n=1 Tax=Pinctada imbricata TaxID=66713 RepID=A0AA88Y786_PINIB|nr:hypothetical protein FSP39_012194 [Pinctada imbricata]